jgi:hypothetical protein
MQTTSVVLTAGFCSLRLDGGWRLESTGRLSVSAFGTDLATVALKMFSHLIYFIKKFNKFCTFRAISENNAETDCISVQHKKDSFPSTSTGHTLG